MESSLVMLQRFRSEMSIGILPKGGKSYWRFDDEMALEIADSAIKNSRLLFGDVTVVHTK